MGLYVLAAVVLVILIAGAVAYDFWLLNRHNKEHTDD